MEKSELVEGLREEYRQWETLLDQIGTARMDQPGVTGHWSVKDIVAHLTGWRRRTVARLQAAQRGDPEPPAPWSPNLQTDDEINVWIYESSRGLAVRQVLDESHEVFQQLLTAVEGLPDEVLREPARHLSWWEGQSMSAADFFYHFHQEHEAELRAWLARAEGQ